jgi:3-deoxy-D-manno-octulosonic-acid transferase
MRFLYSIIMYALTPWFIIRLWLKSWRMPAYKQRISERFWQNQGHFKSVDIWVHAVSLGEVIAATPLIDALLGKKYSILVTTMTPTGSERVRTRFGEQVSHCYIPYDLPYVLKRFYRHIRPKVGVIMETELWPNLIAEAHQADIPLLIANARLSQRSLKGYLKVKWFFGPILNQLTWILAQSMRDAKHFIDLGAEEASVREVGNIKFDLQTNTFDAAPFQALKNRWGANRVLVIAASTHEGEESSILAGLKKLQHAIPGVLLLIAPRHPERFKAVYQRAQLDFNTGLRSQSDTLSPDNEVVILDSLGELLGLYQISHYAFVGGSLVPVGGHNVLEPIAMKVPVFTGSQVHNFKAICDDLLAAKAIQMVHDADELIEAVIALHQDIERQKRMVAFATEVLERNKGSVAKHVAVIEETINHRKV